MFFVTSWMTDWFAMAKDGQVAANAAERPSFGMCTAGHHLWWWFTRLRKRRVGSQTASRFHDLAFGFMFRKPSSEQVAMPAAIFLSNTAGRRCAFGVCCHCKLCNSDFFGISLGKNIILHVKKGIQMLLQIAWTSCCCRFFVAVCCFKSDAFVPQVCHFYPFLAECLSPAAVAGKMNAATRLPVWCWTCRTAARCPEMNSLKPWVWPPGVVSPRANWSAGGQKDAVLRIDGKSKLWEFDVLMCDLRWFKCSWVYNGLQDMFETTC